MSVTPQEFLDSALELATAGTNEICQRNAISRLYYAAFHRAQEFIKPDGVDRGFGSHRNYFDQLNEADGGSTARRLGMHLKVVYSGRIKSDYKLDEDVQPRDFSMHRQRVETIFSLLDNPTPAASTPSPTPQVIPLRRI